MSKLAIILCATVFFASRMKLVVSETEIEDIADFPNITTLSRKITNRHIEQAIEKIDECSEKIYRKVMDLGPQNGSAKKRRTVSYFSQVTRHFDTLKKMTAHFIAAKKLRPENAKNCLNYFATYATVSNGQTMSLLKSVFRDIYSKATMWIGEMLNSANLKKSELNDLKLRANNCVQSECNDISKAANDMHTLFCTDAGQGFEFYKNMTNGHAGMQALHIYRDYNFDMGQDVIQTTFDCALRSD